MSRHRRPPGHHTTARPTPPARRLRYEWSVHRLLACLATLLLIGSACGDGDRDRGVGLVDAGVALADGATAHEDAGAAGDAGPLEDGGTASTDAGPPDRPEDYPVDPLAELRLADGTSDVYRGTSTFGDGLAQFQVWAPSSYSRDRRWPLVVYLHGGGNTTDTAMSLSQGASSLRSYTRTDRADELVWMAGVVRVSGSYHAWAMEANALDLIDAIREVARLFRIDHTRVYLTGVSMGGGGVATLSWIIPDAFAAYAPIVGYYWNDILPAPDLAGVPFRVVAGELDTPPTQPFDRLGLARQFADLSATAGADVELVVMPDVAHAYPSSEVGLTNAFLLSHSRSTPTDWSAVRASADAVLPLFSR